MKIPITKPYIDEMDFSYLVEPLKTGWLVQGPYVKEFERKFCEMSKCKFAAATSSCTTALHLALEALKIRQGDTVIVPSFTYVATANAVEYTGAKVAFCDIDLDTFSIDVVQLGSLCEKLSKQGKTPKAIIAVHLFGLCANMPKVLEIAKKYDMFVVEDAACGFDSWIGEKHSGTFGDAGCFSFHPRKSITTGEGGMVGTNNKDLYDSICCLRNHGATQSDLERHLEKGGSLLPDFPLKGYNYRMTDFQGAMGVSQMQKVEKIMAARRRIASKYDEALKVCKHLSTPVTPDGYKHGYQSYVCLFHGNRDLSDLTIEKVDEINVLRNQFMAKLEEKGIATRQGTHAVHTLEYYHKQYELEDKMFLNSYASDRLSIALPLYPAMTDDEFSYVMNTINDCL